MLRAIHLLGQGHGGFGFTDAAWAHQHEHTQRPFWIAEACTGNLHRLGNAGDAVRLADHSLFHHLLQLQNAVDLIGLHTAYRNAGPVGNHAGNHIGINALVNQWLLFLQSQQLFATGRQLLHQPLQFAVVAEGIRQ